MITLDVTNGVGWIRINRPEVRNALSGEVLEVLNHVLEEWRIRKDISVVIFTGGGDKSFAAGADIGQLKKRTTIDALGPVMTVLYRKIEEYEKATIAAINGYALGGGLELALACDIRMAASHAKMGLPELSLGIIPGAGGTQRLSRIIGKGRAMEMILTGKILTAEKAEQYGLVTTVVPAEELVETAQHMGEKISEKGPLAIQLVKSVVHHGDDSNMGTALLLEKYAQAILMGTKDKQEGTEAFLEKRKPKFTGE